MPFARGGADGGGGGVDLEGGDRSGAELGGGGAEGGGGGGGALFVGGAEGGIGGALGGEAGGGGATDGGGGAKPEGFLRVTGGAGGFDPGRGGATLEGIPSIDDLEGTGNGRDAGFGGGLLRPTSLMGRGGVGRRLATPGARGFGAALAGGGLGAAGVVFEASEIYEESLSAPVSTPPPLFFNFGIPPAKRPPSCGASAITAFPPVTAPLSLLVRFAVGGDGAAPPGGFNMPGTGGAPAATPPPPPFGFSSNGPDRSFVTAFLRPFPFCMSWRSAPWIIIQSSYISYDFAKTAYSVLTG